MDRGAKQARRSPSISCQRLFRPAFLVLRGQNLAQASATAFTEALKSPGKKHEAKRSFRKNT